MKTKEDDCYTCRHLTADEAGSEVCPFDDECQAPNDFAKWEPKHSHEKPTEGSGAMTAIDKELITKIIGTAFRFGAATAMGDLDWMDTPEQPPPCPEAITPDKFFAARDRAIALIVEKVRDTTAEGIGA